MPYAFQQLGDASCFLLRACGASYFLLLRLRRFLLLASAPEALDKVARGKRGSAQPLGDDPIEPAPQERQMFCCSFGAEQTFQ